MLRSRRGEGGESKGVIAYLLKGKEQVREERGDKACASNILRIVSGF